MFHYITIIKYLKPFFHSARLSLCLLVASGHRLSILMELQRLFRKGWRSSGTIKVKIDNNILGLHKMTSCIYLIVSQASRIILATDGDAPGQALAEELARRLGKERL